MDSKDDLGWRTAYRRTTWLLLFVLIVFGAALIILPVLADTMNLKILGHEGALGGLIRDFGFAILIAGSAGVGYEYMLRNAFAQEVKGTLNEIINERNAELDQLRKAGVITVYRRLAHARLADHFEGAKSSIRILQTWSGDFNNIGDTLIRAAKQKCEIKILLLDPESPQAKQRAKDLGYVESTVVKALIKTDLEVLEKCRLRCNEEERNRIKVKLYNSTPVMAIYGYDDTNIVGSYWRHSHSQEGPQLEVHNPDLAPEDHPCGLYLAEVVARHFKDIWECGTTRDYPWKERGDTCQNQQGAQVATVGKISTNALDRNGPETPY